MTTMNGIATPMVFIIAPRRTSMITEDDDENVTWRPRPLVTFYQVTFPVDWIKAKLSEDPNQREDREAGPEEPDGEEEVEDSPRGDQASLSQSEV